MENWAYGLGSAFLTNSSVVIQNPINASHTCPSAADYTDSISHIHDPVFQMPQPSRYYIVALAARHDGNITDKAIAISSTLHS